MNRGPACVFREALLQVPFDLAKEAPSMNDQRPRGRAPLHAPKIQLFTIPPCLELTASYPLSCDGSLRPSIAQARAEPQPKRGQPGGASLEQHAPRYGSVSSSDRHGYCRGAPCCGCG